MIRSLGVARFVLGLLFTVGVVLEAGSIAYAQRFNPPARGLPGRRLGGGTRGECVQSQPTLTALQPDSNFGLTTTAYPTFFWYLPASSATQAEFILLDADSNPVYQTTFQIMGKSGVIRLSLPTDVNLPPLAVGKDYHWFFSLVCDANDRSADVITEGWIQRVTPDAALMNRLQSSPESDRAALYAEAGIWYDALSTVATLRDAQPNNPTFVAQWRTLLDAIGLVQLADQPLLRQD